MPKNIFLAALLFTPLLVHAGKLSSVYSNSIGMPFVTIPAGNFEMGSNNERSDERPVHSVTISKAFMLARTEVTQRQWQAVMGSNPSHFKGDNKPVEQVSFPMVQDFITKLNQKEGCSCYRLPTESEWEYAAQLGKSTIEMAWHSRNSNSSTHDVASRSPDQLGLFDVLGNVWEWAGDWYAPYAQQMQVDPQGPSAGQARVFRGGSWLDGASNVRSGDRLFSTPDYRRNYVGFRLLRTSP